MSPAPPSPRSPGCADDPLLLEAARVAAQLSRLVERGTASVELSLPQYRLLGLLANGSVGASALANRLAVSRPSVTGVVDGLVARGLVCRTGVPGDRRKVVHTLTDAGHAVLVSADAAAAARLGGIAALFVDEAARQQALDGLCAWRDAFDRALATHEPMPAGADR
jgi:long-chain acyl-CoA synthetase